MYRIAAWVGVLVVVATMAASAQAASPDDARTRAEALVAEGLDFARSGKKLQKSGAVGYRDAYRSAIAKFEEANRLYPDPTIQHNLARAHEELGELKVAFDWYALALKQDYDFAKDGRARLTKIESELRKTHALVTVRTTPSDVTVRMQFDDGTSETHVSTPFQTWARAGMLKMVASNPEFKTGNKEYTLTAGEDRAINLVLEPLPRQGFFEVDANVVGAKVFLSEVLVATLPMQSVTYPAGIYELKVTAKGYKTHKEQVVVTKDQLTAVTVALVPDGSGIGEVPVPPTDGGGPPTWIGATLVGVGAGAVILGVVFHAKAFDFNSDANKVPVSDPPIQADEERYDSLFAKAKDNEKYAWISYGAGAALIGTGVVLLVIGGDDEPAAADAVSTGSVSPRFVPSVQAGPGFFGATGTLTF
ncbi:MAG: PEGA domain-containing protein [Deltaproteobacteria bacterium]|nr:MAG: PEGA domain-containing protein [Deltaproteobacteria bacterium]